MNGTRELDEELKELKGFIADLKADRAQQKEKEQREAWTKYTAISLVFIAVLAAIASQWSGKYSSRVLVNLNDSTFHQAEASDAWGYYQAKSIKQNVYEALGEAVIGTGSVASGGKAPANFSAKVDKYKTDEQEIKAKAEHLQEQVKAARAEATRASAKGGAMGNAIAVFQIAVALGSICLVTKKKPLWYLSLAFAALATARMVYVWVT